MFELVVFTEEALTKATFEDSAAKVPDTALALGADDVGQRARARMSLEALPSVANERFAKVANCTDHSESGDKSGRVLNDAVTALRHALYFATLATSWQTLKRLTKVTKSAILLLPLARVAFHNKVAGHFHDRLLRLTNLLLALFHFLSFFALTCFFLRHG